MDKIKELFTNEFKRTLIFLIISGFSLGASFFAPEGILIDPAWIAVVLCGLPIVKGAVVGLVTAFDIKADVLVSLALIASLIIGEIFAAGEIAFIMAIGGFLEETTVAKAQKGLERLVNLTPTTARVIRNGVQIVIPGGEVEVEDLVVVRPGETIPVDGSIVEGRTSIDQSLLTGESLPVDKEPGDEVAAGAVNRFGAFTMKAERVGEDSSLRRMIALVQSADAGKAKIVRLADRWATWIVVIALTAAAVTWAVTGEIIRAVTILVVFCPCALVLATPTAITAAMGNVSRFGILVRRGDALERLAGVKRLALDKTGTLTYGKPEVKAVAPISLTEDELFRYCAAGEQYSEHPLGKAIARDYQAKHGAIPVAENFAMVPGRGISCLVDGKEVLVGNPDFLREKGVDTSKSLGMALDYETNGCTVVHVAVEGKPQGILALGDVIRETAGKTIGDLKAMGLKTTLLTGDNRGAAAAIGGFVGVDDIHSRCLPQDKLKVIGDYTDEGEPVAMVGDGVNDAPALKKAHVGIAMGGVGSDIAVEAADIALVRDDISALPFLITLSRKMMFTIKLNMIFAMGVNFIAIILAITGVIGPVVGALVHNCGSVLVILNSVRLLGMTPVKLGLPLGDIPNEVTAEV